MMKRLFRLLIVAITIAIMSLFSYSSAIPVQASVLHGVPVLMYHYISEPPDKSDISRVTLSVSPTRFREQMKWLKDNGYVTITPDDLVNGKPRPEKAVLLTFDDGYEDAYSNAFPVLREFGQVGTFFLITDWIDQNRPGYLTWDQAKTMKSAGMNIEAHTRSHPALAGNTSLFISDQIVGSMDAIEQHLGYRPRFLAYPFGSYDKTAIQAAQKAGLAAAFTTRNGTVYSVAGRQLVLPRLRMRYTMTLAEFAPLIIRTTS